MISHGYSSAGYRSASTLVLGATGFIGRWVARELVQQGARVSVIVRDKNRAEEIFATYNFSVEVFELSLQDTSRFREVFRLVKPSATFNLAGYGVDPSERDESTAFQINAEFVKTLCDEAAKTRDSDWPGLHIVHVGSALEYGVVGGDLREDTTPNPTTLYGQSKLEGTRNLSRCCAESDLRGITARLFTVYGPGEHDGRLLPSLLSTAKSRKRLPLTAGLQKRDFTFVEDVAQGLLRLGLSTANPGEIVNLATGRLATVRSFVDTAAEILHIPADRLDLGAIPTRIEEMEHAEVSVERLLALTGWVPTIPIGDGIQRTVDLTNSLASRSRVVA